MPFQKGNKCVGVGSVKPTLETHLLLAKAYTCFVEPEYSKPFAL